MHCVCLLCSVQYLQQPERVFAEIYRVLRPGGVAIITFSNRMFYEKAIALWRENSGFGRTQLVKSYFMCVEGFTEPEVLRQVPLSEGQQQQGVLGGLIKALPKPLQQLLSSGGRDPFYGVVAYKDFQPTQGQS